MGRPVTSVVSVSKKKKKNGGIRCVVPKFVFLELFSMTLLLWLAPKTIRAEQRLARKGGNSNMSSRSRSAFGFVVSGGRSRSLRNNNHGSDCRYNTASRRPFTTKDMGAISPLPLAERKRKPFPFSHHHRRFSSSSILKGQAGDGMDDTEIPLVFLHGIKGSHLAFPTDKTDGEESTTKSQRSWLSLGGLLNFPPREDGHPERDISLPLSYTTESDSGASFPVQDRSEHFVDGTVDHVVELSGMLPSGVGGTLLSNTGNLDLFPFYGHATKFLEEVNEAYVRGSDSTSTDNDLDQDSNKERTTAKSSTTMKPRPTRSFCYDWRRNLFEVAEEFHAFCEREFPNGQPVQVVAHSMGGLIAYAAMKKHPSKYEPGGVLVGVPFGTGIQYLQDMHKGYFTELGTCRQFLPPAQFSFSSHWIFFPIDQDEIGDSFVDVSEYFDGDDNNDDDHKSSSSKVESNIAFEADRSTIGKKTSASDKEEETWRPATPGKPIKIDFYDPEEWEKNEFGIFDPFYRQAIDATDSNRISEYKQHMKFQLNDARRWRTTVLAPWKDETTARNHMPPLTICSSVSIPTGNQILRRKRRAAPSNKKVYDYFPRSLISLLEMGDKEQQQDDSTLCCSKWEYDYASGRTVPGDGRIDYDKSFPPSGTCFSTVDLNSVHAKQFCWEENGGDLGTVWEQVNQQLGDYHTAKRKGGTVA